MGEPRSKIGLALAAIAQYGGAQSIGAILASRKGVFGLVAIGLSYYLLLGRLPDGASDELITNMSEIFGMIVGVVAGLFIGGTALEDALKKGSSKTAPDWLLPLASATGEAYTAYLKEGKVDMQVLVTKVVDDYMKQHQAGVTVTTAKAVPLPTVPK